VIATLGGYFVVQYIKGKNSPSSFGPELYYALDLAEQKNDYTKVIIGDSVARLIFSPDYQSETDEVCYLATNQAITVLGNYILLSRYLENNPQTEEVIYIVRPQSLANPLWYNFSFQYFIVPFYNDTYKKYIDEDTRSYIENRFGKMYATNNIVKSFVENNPYYLDVYLNNVLEQQLEVRDEKHLSDLSIKYLPMMKKLCESNGVSFTVLAAPLADTEENHDWSEFATQIAENGLSDILGEYLDGIEYYDESCFSDEAHFTDEYLEENRQEIIEHLLK
ncbi:MAG: hypothetical protein ACI4R6_05305, partial [Lachnospiraceae bacterium]